MKKVIVRLGNGLGNQLFTYAAGYSFAKKNKAELYVDDESGFYKKRYKYELHNFITTASIAEKQDKFLGHFGRVKRRLLKKINNINKSKIFLVEDVDKNKLSYYNVAIAATFNKQNRPTSYLRKPVCGLQMIILMELGLQGTGMVFWLFHKDLAGLAQLHRDLEACFPPGTIDTVYSYLSITELTEYQPTEDDLKARAQREFKLEEGTSEYEAKLAELAEWKADYEKFRLYPEMPDWEIMCFYPMLKKRQGEDNWYMLDFDARKKLMRTHAVTGRKFAGRIKQLITGSSGLDDWEWGVTLMAQQLDAVKEIVYEMRLDEVSAKYAEFGPFYINLRLEPEALWKHFGL